MKISRRLNEAAFTLVKDLIHTVTQQAADTIAKKYNLENTGRMTTAYHARDEFVPLLVRTDKTPENLIGPFNEELKNEMSALMFGPIQIGVSNINTTYLKDEQIRFVIEHIPERHKLNVFLRGKDGSEVEVDECVPIK